MFVVVGTTTADLLVASRNPNASADGFRAGNVVFAETPVRLVPGGNGGIAAYVLAGLGAQVALCSAVGNDPFGRALIDWLAQRGIGLDRVVRSAAHATSTSVILVADPTSQSVIHHLGASVAVPLAGLTELPLGEEDVVLATSYPLVPAMRDGHLAAVLAAAEASGATTALDIGPALGRPVTMQEIGPLLPHTGYLLGNAHEVGRLAATADWDAAAARLLDAGARNVVIKRGREGAALRSRAASADVPAFPVAARSSVGAGDAFDAGFLFGVWRRAPVPEALRLGSAVAALVVSAARGVLDAPTDEQVEEFLAGHARATRAQVRHEEGT